MTREEIDRHVAGILALRSGAERKSAYNRARWAKGFDTYDDFNPRRRVVRNANINNHDVGIGPVDQVFAARGRSGWLPRGGDE